MSEVNVLATVAGTPVTDQDVDAYISNMPQEQQRYASNPQFRQQVLNQIVSIQMFAQMGKDNKLDETEEYQKIVEAAKRDILAQLAINSIVKDLEVSDEEAKAYYNANISRFGKGPTVAAKHILVDDEANCKAIMASIEAGEKSFEDAAKECSSCPSREQGGDLGEFGRGAMVPEFDKAAFEAEVDQLVGPVKTQFGYHIIKVYKKTEGNAAPFAEVANQIFNTLLQSKQEKAYKDTLAELGKKYMA